MKPFDRIYSSASSAYVLFATPGMLNGGTSLAIFKEWCNNPKNTVIIPGYCSPGSVGQRLQSGQRKLDIEGKEYQVNCAIEHLSFSAHADSKGLVHLIEHISPENVVLIHGEKAGMRQLKDKIDDLFGIPCYTPANNSTIEIMVKPGIEMSLSYSSYLKYQQDLFAHTISFTEGSKIYKGADNGIIYDVIEQDNCVQIVENSKADSTHEIDITECLMIKKYNTKALETLRADMEKVCKLRIINNSLEVQYSWRV